MSQITVRTCLSVPNALAACSAEHGTIPVPLTAAQIEALSAEERALLAEFCSERESLTVTGPGWPGIVAGLAAERERREAERAERAAKVEREKSSYRAMLAGPIYEPGLPLTERKFSWNSSPNYSKGDPEADDLWTRAREAREAERRQRVLDADVALGDDPGAHLHLGAADRRPEARWALDPKAAAVAEARRFWDGHSHVSLPAPHLDAVLALRDARNADLDAAEKAKDDAEKEALRAAARAYVLEHVPEYTRAASEGCDVRHRATEHVRGLLAAFGAVLSCSDEPHPCPSARAYAKLDEVTAALAAIPVMTGAEITLTRSDVAGKNEPEDLRTCVRIEHVLPWGAEVDRVVVAEDEDTDE